jgi:hypothetical protein
LTWFVIEADVTARETLEETRLSFFTVLVVRESRDRPTKEAALALIDDYLREVHAPFTWDLELIAVAAA